MFGFSAGGCLKAVLFWFFFIGEFLQRVELRSSCQEVAGD